MISLLTASLTLLAAGANAVCSWPVSFPELEGLLRSA